MALGGGSIGCGKHEKQHNQEDRASTFALARSQLQLVVSRALHRMRCLVCRTLSAGAAREGPQNRKALAAAAAQMAGAEDSLVPRF
jgi:hypothetical protein